jgi:formate dehydrogenase subunit delta
MDITQLIGMANRIGAFFEAMPDTAQGIAGIAEHLQKFWEPRMRRELLAHVAEHGDAQLKPIVRAALKAITPPRSGHDGGSPPATD